MNYYPFHVGDYTSHTAHLEPIEDLAYRRALDAYYLREGPLPSDPAEVARLIRMRGHLVEVESVLREFFAEAPEGWRHERCETEIEAMREKQQKQRDRANKRWHKPSDAPGNAEAQHAQDSGNATAMPRHSHGNANAMPPTPTPTPIPTPTPTPDKERESARAARGTRLPADFALPDDWIAFCESERPDLNAYDTGQRFADYWHAVPGAKGRKTDWLATWRNWVRNEKRQATTAAPARQPQSFFEREQAAKRRQWEEMTGRKWPGDEQGDGRTIDAEPADLLQIGGVA